MEQNLWWVQEINWFKEAYRKKKLNPEKAEKKWSNISRRANKRTKKNTHTPWRPTWCFRWGGILFAGSCGYALSFSLTKPLLLSILLVYLSQLIYPISSSFLPQCFTTLILFWTLTVLEDFIQRWDGLELTLTTKDSLISNLNALFSINPLKSPYSLSS